MTITNRLTIAIALAVVLAACGQADPSPAATGVAADDPTQTASPTEAEGPTAAASPAADASPASDARTPEGWTRVVVADRGFSLAIPEAWEQLSADAFPDADSMQEMLEANPEAAVAIEQGQAALAGGQIALFAFDTTEENLESGFATNLNAIDVGPVEGTAEEAAEEIAGAIEQQIPVTGEVETSTVSLPAGDAALVRYEWEIDDGQGTTTSVTVTQYAIIGDASGNGFILSMSAATDQLDEYEDVFRQIAESFAEEPA
jgi:hypothetical protein